MDGAVREVVGCSPTPGRRMKNGVTVASDYFEHSTKILDERLMQLLKILYKCCLVELTVCRIRPETRSHVSL